MAHLHSVRLRGFKTFARPTELVFEPGVTVIIGPNGSGKSNIADAVLWVLGEQSPGNLRGRSMQDVIFTGPDGRRSSAVAEVSLVFDNECGSLPLDCAQVEVTRRLMRDSTSEYRLNGSACRLLDVQDLFGGLGLGREMHSVISQGKVEAVLNSTPEARRALVEEAAGLGRFKKRRERTRTKLERTRQNLLRVADVEREVKNALRPLRQQVAAAERFAQAMEDWSLARGRLVLLGLLEAERGYKESAGSLSVLRQRRSEVEEQLANLRRRRAEDEERFSLALQQREDLGALYYRLQSEVDRLDARAAALRQRVARNEGDLDRAGRRRDLAESQLASLGKRVEAAAESTPDEGRLALVSSILRNTHTELETALPAYRSAAAHEDDFKDEIFELETARSRAGQERDLVQRQREDKERLSLEVAGLAAQASEREGALRAQQQDLARRVAEADEVLAQAREESSVAAERRDEAREGADGTVREERHLTELLAGLESRQAVLRDLIGRREGLSVGARALLDHDVESRLLTEVLAVEPGYEQAFAAALGPLTQAVLASHGLDVIAALGNDGPVEVLWEKGDVSSPRPGPGTPPPGFRDLWDVVSGPPSAVDGLRRLVPSTAVLAAEEGTAADLLGHGEAEGWRLVTRSGEMLTHGLHAARRKEAGAEAHLRARNELQSVSREQKRLASLRDEAGQGVQRALTSLAQAETAYHAAEEAMRLAERTSLSAGNESDLLARRVDEARRQLEELRGREERERGLSEQLEQAEVEAAQAVEARERELEATRAGLRSLQSDLEVARTRVARLEERKAQAALLEVRLRERCRAQEAERERSRSEWEAAASDAARYGRRVEMLAVYRPVLVRLLECVEQLAEHTRAAALELRARVDDARTRSDTAAQTMREWGGAEAGFQREHDELADRVAALQVESARMDDRRTLLGDELAELCRRHMSPRALNPADVAGESAEALERAAERAEQRRERIGPVNPLAEQECAEMEERARFLAEQRRDLEASLAQLQDVIKGLDEHINTSFGEIFAATKENFAGVIATIFPGANGTLALTEHTDDVGERAEEAEPVPGISLAVKFPNKAPRSMSLLSGGEKAMTAIAFLFSLFLARPCPFYLLDEVEASLDDVNIRRFLALIRRYRDKTQFIVITHQRQTMEIADTLYGVALENDGTSRVLSRRLNAPKRTTGSAEESYPPQQLMAKEA